jgi:hypothetical protein
MTIAPPLIQDGRYGTHLGFGFRRLPDKRLGRLVRFFGGLLGLTGARFLSMTIALPLIQDGRYGTHLGFGFRRLSDKCLSRLVI